MTIDILQGREDLKEDRANNHHILSASSLGGPIPGD